MLSTKWQTSRRQYGAVHERDVAVPVSAGFTIDCDILRPDSSGKFPALLCFFPFSKEAQLKATMPVAVCPQLVMCEGGDFNFYVRRGYAQVFANVRRTGRSGVAMTAKRVAELKPPSLKTIFAPFGVTDQYRQAIFHGGIFSYVFHQFWLKSLSNLRVREDYRARIGQPAFDRLHDKKEAASNGRSGDCPAPGRRDCPPW